MSSPVGGFVAVAEVISLAKRRADFESCPPQMILLIDSRFRLGDL